MKKWMKIAGLLLLTFPVAVQAGDYTYTTNSGKITITKYTGSGGVITIPSTTNSLPVTILGTNSFSACTNLSGVMIGTNITSIGSYAFQNCTSLTGVCFKGNAPSLGSNVFSGATNTTVYRASGATGWPVVPTAWGGRPTALWNPVYLLTVNCGVGGGLYTNQQQVTITANIPPVGDAFDRWGGATQYVASITSSATTVTMPAQDVTLTSMYGPLVSNVKAAQRPGTQLMDITYDVSSAETNTVPVALSVKDGPTVVSVTSVTGDVGAGVETGTSKSIVWNMGVDWKGKVSSGVVFIVTSSVPAGGDPMADGWVVVNDRWVKNTYANGNVTMSDKNTGNMWLYNAKLPGKTNWNAAWSYCTNLTYAGYSDWCLPSTTALKAQYSEKQCFIIGDMYTSGGYYSGPDYWSSSYDTYYAWFMDMWNNRMELRTKTSDCYVWPMRDGHIVIIGTALGSTATADLDTRSYTLTVISELGTPTPPVRKNIYAWHASITCSVQIAVSGRTNSTCSGWTGTGDVPSFGEGNSTGSILLTNLNSSITWLWPVKAISDLWVSNVTATQRPGTKLVDISCGVFSTKTNSVEVSLAVLNGAELINASTVFGAVGSGITTGAVKTIVWNAGADWNGNVSNLTFRILGQDAQGAGVATPAGRVRISAGQNTGTDPDSGAYSIAVTNAFFMDACEISKAQWDTVFNWALTNGYSFANAGSAMATNHPVQAISWYDVAKWCNARSAMEDFVLCYNTNDWSCDVTVDGYRLPTSAEWQYAARGGLSGKRFPWGDTITHSNDNYYSDASYGYDVSTTRGFHPVYGAGTATEGTGTANGYGIYAMAGNVMEWCQDGSGSIRIVAGGSWDQYASEARCSYSSLAVPATSSDYNIGFRTVQRASSSTSADSGSAVPVDARDYQLIVSSEHGTPVPNKGTNLYAWRATVTGSVNSAVTSGLTNWTSAGWGGAGSVPAAGFYTNTGGITLTGLVSSIVWNWNTNYWLEVIKSGSGSVNQTNGWCPADTNLSLTVSPSNGWLFMGWSGDASGDYTATSIIVPIVRPVSITATFSDDADGDGLLNTNETALGTNPRSKDSDSDGMDDPNELVAGTSPTNSASVLAVQLSTDVSANQVSWYGVSGRCYRLEYTDDLANGWMPKGTVSSGANAQILKLDITSGGKRFYRIRVSTSPAGF